MVEIDIPQDGSVIYAEVLYLSGTAEGVPDSQFTIRLINADDQNREQAAAAQAEHQDKPRHGDRRL